MSTTQIPDVTVLAATDRAERHRGRPGVPVWLIFEHLGIPRRSRLVRTQLQALAQDGAIEQRRAHGVDVFGARPPTVAGGCKAPARWISRSPLSTERGATLARSPVRRLSASGSRWVTRSKRRAR